MFRRKKDDEPTAPNAAGPREPSVAAAGAPDAPMPFPRTAAQPAPTFGASGIPKPGAAPVPPRAAPMAPSVRDRQPSESDMKKTEEKKLTVGPEIVLSGQITSCDRLIVEGKVEATLSDSRAVEIAEAGLFKGTAEIDHAVIAGRFEGTLTVRERLTIKSTGRVQGKIRYGQIEIEPGGEIAGEVQVAGRGAAALKPLPEAKPAVQPESRVG